MKLTTRFLAALALIGSTALPVSADEVDPADITTFAAGTQAVAEEVNANFAALISAINDNAQRIEALELAGGAGGVVPVAGGSYTFISFEAQALASNCDPSDWTQPTDPDGAILGPPVYGPTYCNGLNTQQLRFISVMYVINFNADGTGTGTGVYDEEMLATPGSSGLLTYALETQDEASTDNFTFTWSQVGNLITLIDDAPDEDPVEIIASGDNRVALVRQVQRGGAGRADWPLDPDSAIDPLATQFRQVIGIAIRN